MISGSQVSQNSGTILFLYDEFLIHQLLIE